MVSWESYTINEVIEKLKNGELVLPVIQRGLVWKKEKIISLFKTIFAENSFGGIMIVEDNQRKAEDLLFAYRKFSSVFDPKKSYGDGSIKISPLDSSTKYVVDGQQRLSAMFIGLDGMYDNNSLCFDLLSCDEYNFTFAKELYSLNKGVKNDDEKKLNTFWIDVKSIFNELRKNSVEECFEKINKMYLKESDFSDDYCKKIKNNLKTFNQVIMSDKSVGLCTVKIDDNDLEKTRNRVTQLFCSLNQGATILNRIELMRSMLKSYNSEHENFLKDIDELERLKEIGISQDDIMKLIFMLNGKANPREMTYVTRDISIFVSKNKDRIKKCLETTCDVINYIKMFEYLKYAKPSAIAVTLIAYHIFNKSDETKKLSGCILANAEEIKLIKRWFFVSHLNRVFQYGASGWDPNKTGRVKIYEILKNFHGKFFPTDEIFAMYRKHPLNTFTEKFKDDEDSIKRLDSVVLLHLLYPNNTSAQNNHIDHIHSKKKLKEKGIAEDRINLVFNKELIWSSDNLKKSDKEFGEWIKELKTENDKIDFLKKHYIPNDPNLWYSDKYEDFIKERRKLIVEKLNKVIES